MVKRFGRTLPFQHGKERVLFLEQLPSRGNGGAVPVCGGAEAGNWHQDRRKQRRGVDAFQSA